MRYFIDYLRLILFVCTLIFISVDFFVFNYWFYNWKGKRKK